MTTPKQLETALEIAATLYQMIAAHGAGGIPSGHLYAESMNVFANVGAYEACLGLLVRSKLVRREGLILIAATPAPEAGR